MARTLGLNTGGPGFDSRSGNFVFSFFSFEDLFCLSFIFIHVTAGTIATAYKKIEK